MMTEATGQSILTALQGLAEVMPVRNDLLVIVSWLCGAVVCLGVLVFCSAFGLFGGGKGGN